MLWSLFPTRREALNDSYRASLAALSDEDQGDEGDGGRSRERGIAWGNEVGNAVLAWRGADGFSTLGQRSLAVLRLGSGGRQRCCCSQHKGLAEFLSLLCFFCTWLRYLTCNSSESQTCGAAKSFQRDGQGRVIALAERRENNDLVWKKIK